MHNLQVRREVGIKLSFILFQHYKLLCIIMAIKDAIYFFNMIDRDRREPQGNDGN